MDELREKIAAEILGEFGGEHRAGERAREAADCILGIPEIANALARFDDVLTEKT